MDVKIFKLVGERYLDLISDMMDDYSNGRIVWGTIRLVIVCLPLLSILFLFIVSRGYRASNRSLL